MIPIKGGNDKVTHANVSKRDEYTKKISATPVDYTGRHIGGKDLSGDAKNCIPGTDMRNRVPPRQSQSRNQMPTRPIPASNSKTKGGDAGSGPDKSGY